MRIRRSLVVFCLVLTLLLLATCSALAYSSSSAPPSHSSATLDQASVFMAPTIMAVRATHQTTYVYITNTGIKYHRWGCRYLSKSHYKRTLAWAKAHRYTACKVCKPPK